MGADEQPDFLLQIAQGVIAMATNFRTKLAKTAYPPSLISGIMKWFEYRKAGVHWVC